MAEDRIRKQNGILGLGGKMTAEDRDKYAAKQTEQAAKLAEAQAKANKRYEDMKEVGSKTTDPVLKQLGFPDYDRDQNVSRRELRSGITNQLNSWNNEMTAREKEFGTNLSREQLSSSAAAKLLSYFKEISGHIQGANINIDSSDIKRLADSFALYHEQLRK